MNFMQKLTILILAAGQSSRFGSDKLLAPMPDGKPVIAHSLAPLLKLAHHHELDICVITRANNTPLINYLSDNHVRYSICPDADLGMGNSIAHGIKTHQASKGWIITLADMPNITESLLKNLCVEIGLDPQTIVRPKLFAKDKSIPAHPVYFPQKYGFQLSKLRGDQGGKHIIQQQNWLEIKDNYCLIDVDTPEVLQALHKQKERSRSILEALTHTH